MAEIKIDTILQSFEQEIGALRGEIIRLKIAFTAELAEKEKEIVDLKNEIKTLTEEAAT